MAFTVKDWKDAPDTTTPISAAALEDMETRLSNFTAAVPGAYRELFASATLISTAAGSGTKYALIPAQTNASAVAVTAAAQAHAFVFGFVSTEHAIANLTTQLRIKARCSAGAVNPNVTVTVGLYPVTVSGGNYALGTVAGTTAAVVINTTNGFATQNTADFTVVSDGDYCLGCVVSGTPAANTIVQARLLARNT